MTNILNIHKVYDYQADSHAGHVSAREGVVLQVCAMRVLIDPEDFKGIRKVHIELGNGLMNEAFTAFNPYRGDYMAWLENTSFPSWSKSVIMSVRKAIRKAALYGYFREDPNIADRYGPYKDYEPIVFILNGRHVRISPVLFFGGREIIVNNRSVGIVTYNDCGAYGLPNGWMIQRPNDSIFPVARVHDARAAVITALRHADDFASEALPNGR